MGGDISASITAGLPEIQGTFRLNDSFGVVVDDNDVSGAFSCGIERSSGWEGNYGSFHDVNFNASKSNAIYGSADTVQPPSIALIPQIRF